MLRLFFIACLLSTTITRSVGQIVYVSGYTQNPLKAFFFKVDLATCTLCALSEESAWFSYDQFLILPDGTVIRTLGGVPSVVVYPLGGGAATTYSYPGLNPTGIIQMPDGTIYVAGSGGLAIFDPVNGTFNFLGDFPPTINFVAGLFLYNGEVYGFTNGGGLFQVNLGDPSQSVILSGPPSPPFLSGASVPGGPVVGVFQSQILNYDMTTNTTSLLCNFPGYILTWVSPPPPAGPLDCPCGTDAGSMNNAPPASFCTGEQASGIFNNDDELDADDLLQFILFSNPNDTLGSIVATSNTPSFTFNPATMQTGVTYYIAAIAGNNVGGNVDLNDPCLDISNAVQVIWRPLPSVTFSAANPDVCAGACTTVTANFTGTAPFTLTYTSPVSGSVTQTFSSNTGTFQVCTTAGAPPGSLVVQATALTDAFCTCQ